MTGRSHRHATPVGSKLKIGIALSGVILVFELAGGIYANSLALLSDAGHVFTDVLALSLSYYGVRQAGRAASHRFTFGYHRVGVIIAIINAVSILAIAGVIFVEAYQRYQAPPEVNGPVMIGVALIGLGVNLFVVFWLRREQRENLNIRSAFWHALGDALASIGVIIGGVIIAITGWDVVDPVISAVIGLVILAAAWSILREGLHVLLEATPKHIDVDEMVDAIAEVTGVRNVHDIHVWSITPEIHAMSCHVLVDDKPVSEAEGIRSRVEHVLKEHFGIGHTVLQMECQDCGDNDILCQITVEPDKPEPSHQ